MRVYYDTLPSAAARREIDGHLYVRTRMEMCHTAHGQIQVREGHRARLMRVSHIKNGIAFAELGKAGDAVGCTSNLPFSVVTERVEDPNNAQTASDITV